MSLSQVESVTKPQQEAVQPPWWKTVCVGVSTEAHCKKQISGRVQTHRVLSAEEEAETLAPNSTTRMKSLKTTPSPVLFFQVRGWLIRRFWQSRRPQSTRWQCWGCWFCWENYAPIWLSLTQDSVSQHLKKITSKVTGIKRIKVKKTLESSMQ